MSHDYCARHVRDHDYLSYVLTLFAPAAKRPDLWAVQAFRVELSRIRHLTREPMMALIRVEWWRESLQKLYEGEVLRHEVLQALDTAIRAHDLPQSLFQDMVDAYERDLETPSFENYDVLRAHAAAMATPFYALLRQIMRHKGFWDDSLAAAMVMTEYQDSDSRFQPYKETIKKDVRQILKDSRVTGKMLKLLPAILKRRMAIQDRNGQMHPGMWPFYLWRYSLFKI